MVLSLCAKRITTGEISAHMVEVFRTKVLREAISKMTDAEVEEMGGWLVRPLDAVYPVVFIDAIKRQGPTSSPLEWVRRQIQKLISPMSLFGSAVLRNAC